MKFICTIQMFEDEFTSTIKEILPDAKVVELGEEEDNFVYEVTTGEKLTKKKIKALEVECGANLD